MKIVIDHQRYGTRTEFDSIKEAQAACDKLWPAQTTKLIKGWDGTVRDETNEIVGYAIQKGKP